MEKQKNSGGIRPNAGRKRSELGQKKITSISLYPDQKEMLIKKYGTVQKAIDSLLE